MELFVGKIDVRSTKHRHSRTLNVPDDYVKLCSMSHIPTCIDIWAWLESLPRVMSDSWLYYRIYTLDDAVVIYFTGARSIYVYGLPQTKIKDRLDEFMVKIKNCRKSIKEGVVDFLSQPIEVESDVYIGIRGIAHGMLKKARVIRINVHSVTCEILYSKKIIRVKPSECIVITDPNLTIKENDVCVLYPYFRRGFKICDVIKSKGDKTEVVVWENGAITHEFTSKLIPIPMSLQTILRLSKS